MNDRSALTDGIQLTVEPPTVECVLEEREK